MLEYVLLNIGSGDYGLYTHHVCVADCKGVYTVYNNSQVGVVEPESTA